MSGYMAINKKGSALIIVMVFMLVSVIASIGLYNSVYLTFKIQSINEVERIRGYYADLAGLRYATLLLMDTTGYAVGVPVSRNVRITDNALYQNLGLRPPHDLIITITRRADGMYDVSATYNF